MSKPLVWELVKDSERFQFLSPDQVKHVVVDMMVVQEGEEGIWWAIFLYGRVPKFLLSKSVDWSIKFYSTHPLAISGLVDY